MGLFLGVIILCFGIYQMLCYLFFLSTMRSGKEILKNRNNVKTPFFDMISVLMAEKIVTKFQIQWNDEKIMEESLKKHGSFTSGSIYLVSVNDTIKMYI